MRNVALLACATLLAGCGGPPSVSECRALVEHMHSLSTTPISQEENARRPGVDAEFIRTCSQKMQRKHYDCLMDADTGGERNACIVTIVGDSFRVE
jgi:hypothetical protein